MNRLSFHVPVSRTDLHRQPLVPVEPEPMPARGILVGLVLSVPVWWSLWTLATWARGWRL